MRLFYQRGNGRKPNKNKCNLVMNTNIAYLFKIEFASLASFLRKGALANLSSQARPFTARIQRAQ
jgi:hypothetical protein